MVGPEGTGNFALSGISFVMLYIIPQVGLVVKIFLGEYDPPCTEADTKAAHAHKE